MKNEIIKLLTERKEILEKLIKEDKDKFVNAKNEGENEVIKNSLFYLIQQLSGVEFLIMEFSLFPEEFDFEKLIKEMYRKLKNLEDFIFEKYKESYGQKFNNEWDMYEVGFWNSVSNHYNGVGATLLYLCQKLGINLYGI